MATNIGLLLIKSINIFYDFLYIALMIRILLSWIAMGARNNPLVSLVNSITDPIILPIREMIQKSPLGGRGMFIDFSPIFALFIMQLTKTLLIAFINFLQL